MMRSTGWMHACSGPCDPNPYRLAVNEGLSIRKRDPFSFTRYPASCPA
jgi:hypothetical protein